MNVPEDGQSDLSISIDHNVGMRLLTLLNDGSPIVRRVSLALEHVTSLDQNSMICSQLTFVMHTCPTGTVLGN